MGMRIYEIPITSAADGSATVYSEKLEGYVHRLQVVNTDLGASADLTITGEDTGIKLYEQLTTVASGVWTPRVPVHGADQQPISGAYTEYIVYRERIKCVLASGGNAKKATVRLWIADSPSPVVAATTVVP